MAAAAFWGTRSSRQEAGSGSQEAATAGSGRADPTFNLCRQQQPASKIVVDFF